MNNKGFSTVEIIAAVGLFSIMYFIGVSSISYAFGDNPEQIEYDNTINLIEVTAESYVEENIASYEGEKVVYLYVKDLVNANYYPSDEEGNVIDPLTPNSNLNDLKIKVTIDGDKYTANIVQI